MNWKALLPAAALLVLFVPSAAYSRNHHMLGASSMGMMSPISNGGQFLGSAAHGMTSFANPGMMNPYAAAAPVATVAPFAASALGGGIGNGGLLGMNSGLLGMNNGMFNNGMMCGRHHRHKRRRRGLLNALMMQNGGYNNYGYGGGGLLGNSYGYGNYGYGGGLTGGLRSVLGRL
ncbi:MAG TPA: hypothetical protein V6C76_00215 [Drouetiella sp.]